MTVASGFAWNTLTVCAFESVCVCVHICNINCKLYISFSKKHETNQSHLARDKLKCTFKFRNAWLKTLRSSAEKEATKEQAGKFPI